MKQCFTHGSFYSVLTAAGISNCHVNWDHLATSAQNQVNGRKPERQLPILIALYQLHAALRITYLQAYLEYWRCPRIQTLLVHYGHQVPTPYDFSCELTSDHHLTRVAKIYLATMLTALYKPHCHSLYIITDERI